MSADKVLDWALLGYLMMWLPLIWWVNRWPVWLGLDVILATLCLLGGFAVGWVLPDLIVKAVYGWYGVLGVAEVSRFVRVMGGLGAAYVGFRGHLVWLGLAGVLIAGGVVVYLLVFVAASLTR